MAQDQNLVQGFRDYLLGAAAGLRRRGRRRVMALLADPSVHAAIQAILDPAYVPYYLIAFGLVTEFLRRRRATDL